MYRSTNHLRPGLADFGQACGMAVLRTNLDAAPGLDVGLELLSRPGPNLRWNGVVEIQARGREHSFFPFGSDRLAGTGCGWVPPSVGASAGSPRPRGGSQRAS